MVSSVNLRKTGQRWEFESEAALEDFVWANLNKLLKLTPLKRQYRVNGQICDIIAADKNKRLVVLELKNGEDRYIVQQLTRYYDALLEEKPFKEEIDYGQSVHLIAITLKFHKDNFTDRKYNHLSVQFLQFDILVNEVKFYLQLKDIDTEKLSQLKIPYLENDSSDDIPTPSRALLNLFNKGDKNSYEVLLQMRGKILRFDKRMKEMSASGVVVYGKGKSKPCVEIRLLSYSKKPGIFLYLLNPRVIFNKRRMCRMGIVTDWKRVSQIYYQPKGKMTASDIWTFEEYIRLIGEKKSNSLDVLVDIALETWLKRL